MRVSSSLDFGYLRHIAVLLTVVFLTLPAAAKKKAKSQSAQTFEQLVMNKKLHFWDSASDFYQELWGECDDLYDKRGEPISRKACKKYRSGMKRLLYKRHHLIRSAPARVSDFDYKTLTQAFQLEVFLDGDIEENEPLLVSVPLKRAKKITAKIKKMFSKRMCLRRFGTVAEAAQWRKSVRGRIVAQIFATGAKSIKRKVGRTKVRGTELAVEGVRFIDSKTGAIACSNPMSTAINTNEPLAMYGYTGKTTHVIYKPKGKKRGFIRVKSIWRSLKIIMDRNLVIAPFGGKKKTDLLLSAEAGKPHKLILYRQLKNGDHQGYLELEFKVDEGQTITVDAAKLQHTHHGGKIAFKPEGLEEAYTISAKYERVIKKLMQADAYLRKLKVARARKILNDLLVEFPKPGSPVYNAVQSRLKKLGKQ